MPHSRLTPKTVRVLGMIAEGHSYSQIVEGGHDLTYRDVFSAADEALKLGESPLATDSGMARAKRRHARAYEKRDAEEDAELLALHKDGQTTHEMGMHFGRQASAIRSRLKKLREE